MKQVQQNIVSTGGAAGKSAPPPRPPPPVPPPVTHNQTYQTQGFLKHYFDTNINFNYLAPISQMQPQQQLDEPIPVEIFTQKSNCLFLNLKFLKFFYSLFSFSGEKNQAMERKGEK